ncbi:MAG: type IV toxin-antitoxin system AbiEi family antitoxin domain-containing protein [Mycolicibacterium neoaurum]|uniref:type IV toxin-antitoxin system AbiEi family antitoxin domain-containing protein n=1 Tax=Mycolicibacterium neoaurum TaxID=1795 RepID=UPI002FFA440B
MLNDHLRCNDGVITLAQARSLGLSPDAVRRRVRAGSWRRCAPGVYFADDRPFDDAARIRAAVWSYGPAACASGLAAAWWHGLTRFPPKIVEVTLARNGYGRARPGCRPRRRDLDSRDVVGLRGLRVTTLALTAVEAATRRSGGPKIMDSALQASATLPELWQTHMRNKGRYGSPAARRLLRAAESGAQSEAERLMISLLVEHRITGWVANHQVGPYKVDVAFPGLMVAIEVDGWAFHSDPDKFVKDRRRQNYLVLNGWTVIRFTWLDLVEYPDRVISVTCAAISVR